MDYKPELTKWSLYNISGLVADNRIDFSIVNRNLLWTRQTKNDYIRCVLDETRWEMNRELVFNKIGKSNYECIDGNRRIKALCDYIKSKQFAELDETSKGKLFEAEFDVYIFDDLFSHFDNPFDVVKYIYDNNWR